PGRDRNDAPARVLDLHLRGERLLELLTVGVGDPALDDHLPEGRRRRRLDGLRRAERGGQHEHRAEGEGRGDEPIAHGRSLPPRRPGAYAPRRGRTKATRRIVPPAAHAAPNQNGALGAMASQSTPAMIDAGSRRSPTTALRMPYPVARSSTGARSATSARPTASLMP